MVRWDDFKADAKEVLQEFKRQKIGWVGAGLITMMIIIGLAAPYIAPGVPDDWRKGSDRWSENPSQAPPMWIDWVTRDDYARQRELGEWESNNLPEPTHVEESRDESAVASHDESLLFTQTGTHTVGLYQGNNSLNQVAVQVNQREGVESLDVTDFSVDPVADDSFDTAPVDVRVTGNVTHTGTFEAGAAEDKELTLDRTEFGELEPLPEGDNITPSSALKEEFLNQINYLEEGDLDGSAISQENGEWWLKIDGEREFRFDIPTREEMDSFSIDRAEHIGDLEEGSVPPALRTAFEENGGEYQFNLSGADYSQYLEEGQISPELRGAFSDENVTVTEDAELVQEDGAWWVTMENRREYRIDESADLLNIFEVESLDEYQFSIDDNEYGEYIRDGPLVPELRNQFGQNGFDLDEELFTIDAYEDDFNLTEGQVPDRLSENFSENAEVTLTEDAELVQENGTWWIDIRDERTYNLEVKEVQDGANNLIAFELQHELFQEDGEWRISFENVIYDRWDRTVTKVDEVDFRIEENDGSLDIYEFDAMLSEEHEEWWVNLGDDVGYWIEDTGDSLDIYEVDDHKVYGKAYRDISLDMPEGESTSEKTTWTLEPGEQEDIFLTHTFRFDGRYAMYLGEEGLFFDIGVGDSVAVENFQVNELDAENLRYEASADVVNLVEEEQTIQMRIDEKTESGYSVMETQTFDLDPLDERSITFERSFQQEGEYYFVVGSQQKEVSMDTGEEEEAETASVSSATSSGEELSSQEGSIAGTNEMNINQQQEEGELNAEFVEPSDDVIEVTQGEFQNFRITINNYKEEIQEVELRRETPGSENQTTERIYTIGPGGQKSRYTYTFEYDMQADRLPKELYIELSGRADRYSHRSIFVERPDSDQLADKAGFRSGGHEGMFRLEELLPQGDKVGEIEQSISLQRRMDMRENIRSQIKTYFKREYPNASMPGIPEMTPSKIIFGKANENWLEDPDPLKGTYKFHIQLSGINLELEEDETNVHVGGAVFGIMGTDRSRRDLFLGWVWGARYGLYAGGIVALATIGFATTYGMTSAYYGGWVDELMSRLQEIMMGIPLLPILIILLRFWNQSINVFVLVYALLIWRGSARVVRARGLQVAQDTYIEAAESLGSGATRIIFKHMIPDILPYAIAQAALIVPIVIMAEAGMHILGLGDPNVVTWGTILNEANKANAVMAWRTSWFWVLFPGIGMMLIGFGFISTGMAIERIINPEMRQR